MNKNAKKPEVKLAIATKKDERAKSKTKEDSKGKKPEKPADKKMDTKKNATDKQKLDKKNEKPEKKPRGVSGYLIFSKENREKAKKDHPDAENKELMGVRIIF